MASCLRSLGALLGHGSLVLLHPLLHLSLDLLYLYFLDLDDFLDLLRIAVQHLVFSCAVLLGLLILLFDEVAGSDLDEDFLGALHLAGNVEGRRQGDHDFLVTSVLL